MGKRKSILSSGNDLKWDSSSSRSREPQHRRPTSEPTVLLLSKGPDNGTSFWEKKVLCCEVDQQEDRRQASQICLWDPGIKVDLKGLGELQTWKLIGSSPISLYKLLGLLEAKFSLLKGLLLHKGLWGQHYYSLSSRDWRFLAQGHLEDQSFHPAHAQCCLYKIPAGLINQQAALRKQTQFKLVSISRAVLVILSNNRYLDGQGRQRTRPVHHCVSCIVPKEGRRHSHALECPRHCSTRGGCQELGAGLRKLFVGVRKSFTEEMTPENGLGNRETHSPGRKGRQRENLSWVRAVETHRGVRLRNGKRLSINSQGKEIVTFSATSAFIQSWDYVF